MAKPTPLHLRVFVSSPGDVADERALVRRLLTEELPYDPFLRGRVTLDVVSWDDPAAPAPMLATLTPQEAVNRGLAKPSDCNIDTGGEFPEQRMAGMMVGMPGALPTSTRV